MGGDPRQRPGPRLPPLGFAPTRVSLTFSLGPAATRGPSFVAPRTADESPHLASEVSSVGDPLPWLITALTSSAAPCPAATPRQLSLSTTGPQEDVRLGTALHPGIIALLTHRPAPGRDGQPCLHLGHCLRANPCAEWGWKYPFSSPNTMAEILHVNAVYKHCIYMLLVNIARECCM